MVVFTYIARVADGVMLVASMDGTAASNVARFKSDGKQLLKQLNHNSPRKCTIEAGPYQFHYLIDGAVCYLTLTEASYPKRLAFCFLDELQRKFVDHVRLEHGAQWEHRLATIDRPYAFIKFDKTIQRMRKEYGDPHSRHNASKLNDDLQDIQTIMKRNIQEVLNRGEKLDHVSAVSSNLVSESKKFSWGAKKLNYMAMWKKYAPVAGGMGVMLFFLVIRFYVMI